jgi:hypothetical protein
MKQPQRLPNSTGGESTPLAATKNESPKANRD